MIFKVSALFFAGVTALSAVSTKATDIGLLSSQVPRPPVRLRSTPATLDDNEVLDMLRRRGFFDRQNNASGSFANEFESLKIGDDSVVIDRRTGLMWHQSGLDKMKDYEYANGWIEKLNDEGYAGYHDWRLPTGEEGASLLESAMNNSHLYIDAVFSPVQTWIWTCDRDRNRRVWVVNFRLGMMGKSPSGGGYRRDVRPVRSGLGAPDAPARDVARWADEWRKREQRMLSDYQGIARANRRADLTAERRINSWESFLERHDEDDPLSLEDDSLREQALMNILILKHTPRTKRVDVNGLNMEMVWIPEGEFIMGDTSPRVRITRGFWIGKFEVTQALWKKLMGRNPSSTSTLGDDHPVNNVNWRDCQRFIIKLNALTGGKFRLPTEAEWEYACRAGTRWKYYWGSDASRACQYANVKDQTMIKDKPYLSHGIDCDDGYDATAPVGSFRPNVFGLYDMLGNVEEWCSDWYASYPRSETALLDPRGPSKGKRRVARGGNLASGAYGTRCSQRNIHDPSKQSYLIGFRLVEDP